MVTTTNYTPEEPIVAIATALSPAALGVIRVSGKNVIEQTATLFSRPKALKNASGNTLLYGWIQDKEKNNIDEVMLGIYRAPKSFTGEDMVEIYCHGGTSVVLSIYHLFLENGFREAERGEFSFRSFINGKADLTKAEAIREIIEAKTDTSRSRAAGRLAGSLYEQLTVIKKQLIATLAAIEAEIEYPEDENAIADAFDKKDLEEAYKALQELSASWKSEKLYQDGARLILCGKTNAGKSSLFNALLKEERSIVSDVHGTTRDWIESWISFDGIPARLFDTAGLRITADTVEQIGVEMTKDLSKDADILLYVIDSSKGITQEDREFLQENTNIPIIVIFNKIDTLHQLDELKNISLPENTYSVLVSAKTSNGLKDLTEQVKKILLHQDNTERKQAGLGSERQKIAIDEALDSLSYALHAAEKNYPLDAVVQDIEDALDFLGEITGEVNPDDILESIFSRFCVGK